MTDLGSYLRARRAAITPELAGVRSYGARRVPGLRREELARLAGVSVAYYTRLEQGQSANASDSVIASLARALRLDDDERAHLFALARPAPVRRTPPPVEEATPSAVRLLAAMHDVPALLLGRRNDVLAWNRLGHLLLAGHLDPTAPERPADRPNLTRMLFLDAHTRDLHRDWAAEAALAVASLRYVAAEHPDDPLLASLIGDLSINSPEFATLWPQHTVRLCTGGTRLLHHPEVGPLDLDFTLLHLPDAPGHRLMTHTPQTPSSTTALTLLNHP
ncbi:helix-turn-helix transcriptional regulator [Actinocorallia sp. A-T 12471]|uniref:helix-turn-helix transcriptional regulator n=1 Tax=Actinocorallia sp. A-T 12471 TaxID=3089813 RepID=UPI0029CD6D26|nr:helix-turn-helix transcriptional regulator [Actinocorallia sp. A-T 12471]MDX6742726.1 helix-turn-helix transcriptional regulator [Actinocorallia sp. A-T 12471]